MPLESATYISDLDTSNPVGSTDKVQTLDDHVRLIKSTLKTTFPSVTGAVTPTHTELNYVDGVTSAIQTQLDAKAAANALNASNLTSGTIPDARFPATLPAASGANLTNLDASDLASGTVPDARLSSNVAVKNSALTSLDGGSAADPGYLGVPPDTKTADYSVVPGDAGRCIITTSACDEVTFTSGCLAAGQAVMVANGLGGNLTLVESGVNLYLTGTGTHANRTVSVNGLATVYCTDGATTFLVQGPGVS